MASDSSPKELIGASYDAYRGIKGTITATPTKIPELGPKDILIKLTHTGVCYTDREFYRVGAPLALGHEGAGVAVAVGSAVSIVSQRAPSCSQKQFNSSSALTSDKLWGIIRQVSLKPHLFRSVAARHLRH